MPNDPADVIIINDSRPTRSDAVRNRDHILDTARGLIDAHGVESVTMSAIAQEARVGKGTLYRNFADKAAVCHALLDQQQRELQERVLLRLRDGGQPAELLAWFIEQVMAFVWNNLDLLGSETVDVPLGHPAHFWWRQTLRGLIAQGSASYDVDHAADVCYLMLEPRAVAYQRARPGVTLERLTQAIQTAAARLAMLP